jgi:hypothetical protein
MYRSGYLVAHGLAHLHARQPALAGRARLADHQSLVTDLGRATQTLEQRREAVPGKRGGADKPDQHERQQDSELKLQPPPLVHRRPHCTGPAAGASNCSIRRMIVR